MEIIVIIYGDFDMNSHIVMVPASNLKRYDPIVHVFSHQRHTMHVAFYEVDGKSNGNNKIDSSK